MKKTFKGAKIKKGSMVSAYDALGSYTGVYLAGEYEDPVQDADDL